MRSTDASYVDHTWKPYTADLEEIAVCEMWKRRERAADMSWIDPEDDDWPQTRLWEQLRDEVFIGCIESLQRVRSHSRILVRPELDLFHPARGNCVRDPVFHAMRAAKEHTYLVQTGFPAEMAEYARRGAGFGDSFWGGQPNVWFGMWAGGQIDVASVDLIGRLPVGVRWLGIDVSRDLPDLSGVLDRDRGINWVVASVEVGPDGQPGHLAVVEALRTQCRSAGVSFFCERNGGDHSPHRE